MLRCALAIMAVLTTSSLAHAHIAMRYPVPRDPNGLYQTTFPCGGLKAGPATTLTAGSSLNLQWINQIAHPGSYRVSLASDPNAFPSHVVLEGVPSHDATGDQNQSFNLPQQPCSPCVLQLVQVNTSGSDPNTPSGSIEYVACADVDITAAAVSTGTTTGSSTAGTTGGDTTGGSPSGDSSTTSGSGSSGGCAAIPPTALMFLLGGLALGRRRETRRQ